VTAEQLSEKYIAAMEKTLQNAQISAAPVTVSKECIDEIFGYVKSYLQDAKYFREQKKFETSLVSIAYCEGLLDALKLIGAVNISTPKQT
jgi:hypothetical protein